MLSHRSIAALALAICCGAALRAQDNTFFNYASDATQNCTSFTARHGLGTDAGWMFKQFEGFSAVGNKGDGLVSSPGELTGFTCLIQDQDGSTVATYEVAVLREDPIRSARPECPPTAATILATTGPIPTPGGMSGPAAWRVNFTLGAPADVLPTTGTIFQGVRIPLTTTWTADGLSWQGTWFGIGASPGPHVIGLTWFCNTTQGNQLGVPNSGRNPHAGIMTTRPVFETGGDVDPAFRNCTNQSIEWGATGQWLDFTGRGDGLAFRIKDVNHPNTNVAALMSFGGLPVPVNIPGLLGWLCVSPALVVPVPVGTGVTDAQGEWIDSTVFGRAAGGLRFTGVHHFQGVLLTPNGALLTNAVQIDVL